MTLVGKKAKDFTLPDHTGKKHSLSDYVGKFVVLYFYPKDNTPGCTIEAEGFRDSYNLFESKNIIVIGISGDSMESHAKFIEKKSLPFVLLSDTKKTILEKYSANEIGGKRKTYLINKKGIIVKEYLRVTPQTHAKEIVSDIEEENF